MQVQAPLSRPDTERSDTSSAGKPILKSSTAQTVIQVAPKCNQCQHINNNSANNSDKKGEANHAEVKVEVHQGDGNGTVKQDVIEQAPKVQLPVNGIENPNYEYM